MSQSEILSGTSHPADRRLGAERLSRRVQGIRMSPTIAMNERAAALSRAGIDVISLSVGEPDFETPERILEAAYAAAKRGFTRYTAADGAPVVKEAVRSKLDRDNKLSYELAEIHVASGAKQVIFNALTALLDPGDEVVIFSPYWVSYADAITLCGGVPVIVPTTFEDQFQPSPELLRRALTARTRIVLLNSPNNPTGAVYTEARLLSLLAVLEARADIVVLSDEIYEHLIFDRARHHSLAAIAPRLRDRILTINGVSKSYAMTGWRIGFAAGPRSLIEAMARVQSQTSGNASSISQAAAAEAMAGDQRLLLPWRRTMQQRRDMALAEITKSPRLRVFVPLGAFYLFVDVAGCIGSVPPSGKRINTDVEFAEYLLDAARVAVVPGEAFGASPYVRLSFALNETRLVDACRRIVAACAQLKDRH